MCLFGEARQALKNQHVLDRLYQLRRADAFAIQAWMLACALHAVDHRGLLVRFAVCMPIECYRISSYFNFFMLLRVVRKLGGISQDLINHFL